MGKERGGSFLEMVSAAEKGERCFLNLCYIVEAFLLALKAIEFLMNLDCVDPDWLILLHRSCILCLTLFW